MKEWAKTHSFTFNLYLQYNVFYSIKKLRSPYVSLFIGGYQARQLRRRYLERTLTTVATFGVLFWLGINFVKSPSQFFQASIIGLSNGVLYALIALGYTLVYGIIELINFAHGDLFMLAAVFSANFITIWFHKDSSGPAAWGVFLMCLLSVMLVSASVNVGIERFAYRRLRRAPKLAPLSTAVGVSFVLQFIGLRWNGSGQKTWNSVLPSGRVLLGSIKLPYTTLISFAVTIPILAALTFIVTKTRQGKAMRATAQDQDASRPCDKQQTVAGGLGRRRPNRHRSDGFRRFWFRLRIWGRHVFHRGGRRWCLDRCPTTTAPRALHRPPGGQAILGNIVFRSAGRAGDQHGRQIQGVGRRFPVPFVVTPRSA